MTTHIEINCKLTGINLVLISRIANVSPSDSGTYIKCLPGGAYPQGFETDESYESIVYRIVNGIARK